MEIARWRNSNVHQILLLENLTFPLKELAPNNAKPSILSRAKRFLLSLFVWNCPPSSATKNPISHIWRRHKKSTFCSLLRAFLLSSALRFLLTPSRYQQFTAINQRGHGTNKTIAVWLLSTRAQGSEKLSNPRRCSSNTITRIDNEKIHPALLPN